MLKKLIFGAGVAYMARKFMGGRRTTEPGYSRSGFGSGGGLFGGSRWGRRDSGW